MLVRSVVVGKRDLKKIDASKAYYSQSHKCLRRKITICSNRTYIGRTFHTIVHTAQVSPPS